MFWIITILVLFSLQLQLIFFGCTVAGAHVNPAVSLAMVILGKLPLKKFPVYVLAQFLGAFAGSCAVYGLYYGGCKCVNIITPRELSSRIILKAFLWNTIKSEVLFSNPPSGVFS